VTIKNIAVIISALWDCIWKNRFCNCIDCFISFYSVWAKPW